MGFNEELGAKVYELIQRAWVAVEYSVDDGLSGRVPIFKIPECDPDQVWEAYEPFFNTQDPEDADDTTRNLMLAAEELYEAQFKHFEGIAVALEEWSGSAATAFKNRLEDLWWSVAKQQRMIEEVQALYLGYQALIRGTRQDILAIADATIETLKAYREQQRRQSQARNMVAATMLIGAVATVATAGIALPATASATAANAVLATAAVNVTKTMVEGALEINALRRVEGDNPDEIINSMFSRIRDLLADTQIQVDAVVAGFREASDIMLDRDLVPPPPPVAHEAFDPEEFRVPSDIMPDSVAESASHDPLLPSKQPR